MEDTIRQRLRNATRQEDSDQDPDEEVSGDIALGAGDAMESTATAKAGVRMVRNEEDHDQRRLHGSALNPHEERAGHTHQETEQLPGSAVTTQEERASHTHQEMEQPPEEEMTSRNARQAAEQNPDEERSTRNARPAVEQSHYIERDNRHARQVVGQYLDAERTIRNARPTVGQNSEEEMTSRNARQAVEQNPDEERTTRNARQAMEHNPDEERTTRNARQAEGQNPDDERTARNARQAVGQYHHVERDNRHWRPYPGEERTSHPLREITQNSHQERSQNSPLERAQGSQQRRTPHLIREETHGFHQERTQPYHLEQIQNNQQEQVLEDTISQGLKSAMGEAVRELSVVHQNALGVLTGEFHRFTEQIQTAVTRPIASAQPPTTRMIDSSDEDGFAERGGGEQEMGFTQRNTSCRLPPFTGKEKWLIWFNRFTEVATIQGWNTQHKLTELLPRLQGPAGEFVYGQLSHTTRTCYSQLVRELNNRFRIVETTRTFGAQFSKCNQKSGQSAEDYSAELKMLYDKAHANRDHQTRAEDLLRRFLDGLNDDRARFHVEFVKEPVDVDQAVFEIVNFQETRRRPGGKDTTDTRDRRAARLTKRTTSRNQEYYSMMSSDSSDEFEEEEQDSHRAARVPSRPKKNQRIVKIQEASDHQTTFETKIPEELQHTDKGADSQQVASILTKLEERFEKEGQSKPDNVAESQQIISALTKLDARLEKLEEQRPGASSAAGHSNSEQWSNDGQSRITKRNECFNCGDHGHFARECPTRYRGTGHRQAAVPPRTNYGSRYGTNTRYNQENHHYGTNTRYNQDNNQQRAPANRSQEAGRNPHHLN